ncbi:DUF1573 domain-containing protein [uncultured Flavobacterium sp.]|uniref:DUF1573 domain-containing protein n=1 Tax=uncultured Flavobacterium sp. TaxID=165435 RepID=UPI0030CA4267|tara:strand:- start:1623 stop:2048 length:426 start_codon:yes stop_codon:yes gene_type:complete
MKNLFRGIAILFISISSYAQGAKIEFKEETINYGNVTKEEDSGKRTFEFTNTGDAPLEIRNVKSTCGCTIPTKPTEPIMPGESDVIEVQYNMNLGPISKSITVETNAVNVESGMVTLRIKGTVIPKKVINLLEKKKSILEQ